MMTILLVNDVSANPHTVEEIRSLFSEYCGDIVIKYTADDDYKL